MLYKGCLILVFIHDYECIIGAVATKYAQGHERIKDSPLLIIRFSWKFELRFALKPMYDVITASQCIVGSGCTFIVE